MKVDQWILNRDNAIVSSFIIIIIIIFFYEFIELLIPFIEFKECGTIEFLI